MNELKDAQRTLARQRYWLLERHPFFATPLLQLRHVADSSVASVASDGTELRYNPHFVNTAKTDDLRYQLCQVVLACMLHHHTRRGDRDYDRWQVASQLVIRPILYKAGLTLESDPSIETSIDRAYGMIGDGDGEAQNTARIDDAPSTKGDNPSDDATESGNGDNSDIDSDDLPAAISASQNQAVQDENEKWDRIAAQSASLQRTHEVGGPAGSESGAMLSQIEAQSDQQIDWREILREFMTQPAKMDYSWSTPNRRYIDSGLYLPGAEGQARGRFVLAIDTSGSMSDSALSMVWSEVLGICEDTMPESVTVMFADTEIKSVQEFEYHDLPESIHMPGRGGTCFSPVFAEVDTWDWQPDALVFLTDMCADDFPARQPDYPVLWAGIDFVMYPNGGYRDVRNWQGVPPWGDRVSLTVEY